MQVEPHDPLDEHEQDPNAATPLGEDAELTRIPPPLRNWQVLEDGSNAPRPPFARKGNEDATDDDHLYRGQTIDGEATVIHEVDLEEEDPPAWSRAAQTLPAPYTQSIREQVDEFVVARVPLRRVTVMPGNAVELTVEVANLGRWAALFEITLEGWIDESWCPELPLRVQLEPEMRRTVSLVVAPPRTSACLAGEHPMAVVVRAARYPGHVTRLAAMLSIEPFVALRLGTPQPHDLHTTWFVPAATLYLPLHNEGNTPATVHVQATDAAHHCDFTFLAAGAAPYDAQAPAYTPGHSTQITLAPGQSLSLPVEVRPRQRPLIGLMARRTPIRFVARVATDPPLRRMVDAGVESSALIGPWHMAIAGVLTVVALFGVGLAGLALLVALRSAASGPVPQAAPAQVSAPPVTFVIQMNQPMPTRGPNPVGMAPLPEAVAPEPRADAPLQPPTAPIVRADQVTAPGQPTPVGAQALRPIVTAPDASLPAVTVGQPPAAQSPAATARTDMTYGQMFQAVAQRYDLDWRILAAVAYLESGFDSLALSGQGDMGLMQIRPPTWQEFAPAVDASDPFDAYSNVQVGAVYLDYLRTLFGERGHPQVEWMLVAYNWGPDKVLDHLAAGGTWETLSADRRQYAEDVLRISATIPVQ